MNPAPFDPSTALRETQAWVDRAVIGLNLCPFAKAVRVKGQIRWRVTDAADAESLLQVLCDEMHFLAEADPAKVDTTLIVHPFVLGDFLDFNDFLEIADAAVAELGYAGVLQVANFHPHYRFDGTDANDVANATNRSPYPTLHLLREDSVERAVDAFDGDTDAIIDSNLQTLQRLGSDGWTALRAQCRHDANGAESGPTPP